MRKAKYILVGVLVILLAVSLAQIANLENELNDLRRNYTNELNQLRREIQGIYDNVDTMLREEASLLSGVEAEYGSVDLENHTIQVDLTVIPKTISNDMTLSVSVNGRTAKLKREDNAYVGAIPVDLFIEDEQILLTIKTAEGVQTQYLQEVYLDYLWDKYLPSLYHGDLFDEATYQNGTYTLSGGIDLTFAPGSDVRFEKFVLVTCINGAEQNRMDISEDVLNHELFDHGVYFSDGDLLEKTYAVREGDELRIDLEATDTLGYVHRILVHYWKQQSGMTAEAINAGEIIYDAAGNLVYGNP